MEVYESFIVEVKISKRILPSVVLLPTRICMSFVGHVYNDHKSKFRNVVFTQPKVHLISTGVWVSPHMKHRIALFSHFINTLARPAHKLLYWFSRKLISFRLRENMEIGAPFPRLPSLFLIQHPWHWKEND